VLGTSLKEAVIQSVAEEKTRHLSSAGVSWWGISYGELVGVLVTSLAVMSSLWVIYKTWLEIKLSKKQMELVEIQLRKEKEL